MMKKSILLVNDINSFKLIHEKTISLTGMNTPLQVVSTSDDIIDLLNKQFAGSVDVRSIVFLDFRMRVDTGCEFLEALRSFDIPSKERLALVAHLPGFTRTDMDLLERFNIRICRNRPPNDDDLRFIVLS